MSAKPAQREWDKFPAVHLLPDRCDAVVVSRAKRVHAMPCPLPLPFPTRILPDSWASLADRSIGRCSRGPLDNESAERWFRIDHRCFHSVPTLIFMLLGNSRHLYCYESAPVSGSDVWHLTETSSTAVAIFKFPLYHLFCSTNRVVVTWRNRLQTSLILLATDRNPKVQNPRKNHCATLHISLLLIPLDGNNMSHSPFVTSTSG